MDTVHCCLFLALIFIVFVECTEVQHEDGITYVSKIGIDNISCFNAGIGNPCQSFTYVLLNTPISCDDTCVIIILDSQSRVINSTNSIVFRESQSLHVSSVNLQMVNVSFGDIQINSNGSSNLTFENLTLVFGSVLVYLFKQVEFRNVVIKCSNYGYSVPIFNFSFVDTVILRHAYFQTTFSEFLVSAEHVNTAIVTNCSFIENNSTIVLSICAYKLTIEHCTFENNYAVDALLFIDICYDGQVSIDYNITTCSFINNTALSLILAVTEMHSKSLLGTMNFNSNNFQRNSISNQAYTALIFILSGFEEIYCLLTNNSFTYNVGTVVAFSNLSKVTLKNTSFGNNMIPQNHFHLTTIEYCAVVYIESRIFHMKNVQFFDNIGTPLVLINTQIYFMGINTFLNNVAMYGGGIYFNRNAVATFHLNSHVVFVNNTAQYGAVYIGNDYSVFDNCVIDAEQTAPFHLTFSGNSARTGTGANIFSYQSWCDCHSYDIPIITCDIDPLIVSYPTKINVSKNIELYPGETIKLNFSVTDCNGTASACNAHAFIGCADRLVCPYISNATKMQLAGPVTVFLSSGIIDTALVIESTHYLNHQNSSNESAQLYFKCRNFLDPSYGIGEEAIANITVHLIDCPLGLVYENNTKECRCAVSNTNSFLCSAKQGQVCIRKGYWYTHIADKPIVTSCPYYSYCYFNRNDCPTDVEYILLPQIQDDQCRDGHGGTLCMNCAENNTFTYLALKCIDNSLCQSWHPYMLLMLTITFPLLIGIALILSVQIQSDIGSGYLYGPLFFLAVLSQLPLGQYPTLDKIVSVFAASVLLQFKAFGFIPWCFFPSMNPLYSTFLQFLNPIIMFVVLLTTVFVARRYPRTFLTLQRSPMQAMCILILVSYWSLIETSILILTPVYFNENTVVLLQPHLLYLHEAHIPSWIISLLIMISLGVLVFLIILSQCFNFHRMKPLLDELQSCYHDKYRWYGAVYVCTWITIQVSLYRYVVFQTVILAVTLAHCLVQPYKKKWLNMSDTCLLLDLLFLTALLPEQNQSLSHSLIMKELIIYLLVMIPLCFIGAGAIGIITVRTGLFSLVKRFYNCCIDKCTRRQNTIQQFGTSKMDSFIINDHEREPLIRIVQEN